jgi:hypothetical protein
MCFRATSIVCFSLAIGGVALAARQDPAAPSTRTIEIQAVALDRDGKPVDDLKPGDLEVWIAGARVPVQDLVVPPTPNSTTSGRLIVLLLDDISLDPAMVARARDVANRFVSQIRPGDRMGVTRLNGGSMHVSSGAAELRAEIDKFRQSLGVMPVEDLGAQLLGRVAGIAGAIVEAPEPRKIIVAIGSAWLLDTPVPPGNISARDVRREWFEAIRAMGVAGANYYVIDPRGVGGSRQLGGSTGLAREAGGYAFVNTNDFSGAVQQVLSDADHYYIIRVGDPPFGRKAVVRELEVKSSRRGVTIRARRGIPGGGA